MTALIAASAVRTCLGDGARTFAALLRGDSGLAPLRHLDARVLNVAFGYQMPGADDGPEPWFQPSHWLAECVREAVQAAALVPSQARVIALVGTGLRELRAVEREVFETWPHATEALHFGASVRAACPGIADVITLSNACSAGGHALALAQDLLEQGEADAVVVAATDGLTASMLAMLGRFAATPTARVQPFDRARLGALLGEGAAVLVLVPERAPVRAAGRLLACGLSCDAVHETVPDGAGIRRAVDEALARARRQPADVDLVIAHGTGTALNDPTEAGVLAAEFGQSAERPWITGIKGALGHTSGAAALMSVDVALRCLAQGVVPPVVGLEQPIDEAHELRLVRGTPVQAPLRLAQVNAFGFGGVNAVSLIEAVA